MTLQSQISSIHRGQVGIGTLIVFIAMVLVAAIAAGVLINTATLLQTQAEATSEESTASVSDRVQMTSFVGFSFDNESVIHHLDIVHRKAPGSGPINLSETTWTVEVHGQSVETVHASDNNVVLADFTDTGQEDVDELPTNETVLQERDDQVLVIIQLNGLDDIDPLQTNEQVTVVAHSPSGAESRVSGTTPQNLQNKSRSTAYRL